MSFIDLKKNKTVKEKTWTIVEQVKSSKITLAIINDFFIIH